MREPAYFSLTSFRNGRFPSFIEGSTVSTSIRFLTCRAFTGEYTARFRSQSDDPHRHSCRAGNDPLPLKHEQLLPGCGQLGSMLVASTSFLNIPAVISDVGLEAPAKQIIAPLTPYLAHMTIHPDQRSRISFGRSCTSSAIPFPSHRSSTSYIQQFTRSKMLSPCVRFPLKPRSSTCSARLRYSRKDCQIL